MLTKVTLCDFEHNKSRLIPHGKVVAEGSDQGPTNRQRTVPVIITMN